MIMNFFYMVALQWRSINDYFVSIRIYIHSGVKSIFFWMRLPIFILIVKFRVEFRLLEKLDNFVIEIVILIMNWWSRENLEKKAFSFYGLIKI